MSSMTVELRLRVRYERTDGKTPDFADCESLLTYCVQHLANQGLLSGESDTLMVESYRSEVKVITVD